MFERINQICKVNGTTVTALCKEITGSSGNLPTWKNGNIRNDYLIAIAKKFGVSTDYLLGRTLDSEPRQYEYPNEATHTFPIIGIVCAGYGGLAEEIDTGDTAIIPLIDLHGRSPEEFFVLRVSGNSMYPLIVDGDIALVRRTTSVDSGKIAVVLYDNEEATVKRVRYVYGEDWLELIPANPEYETKRIEGEDLESCRVLGQVIETVRKFF